MCKVLRYIHLTSISFVMFFSADGCLVVVVFFVIFCCNIILRTCACAALEKGCFSFMVYVIGFIWKYDDHAFFGVICFLVAL